MVDFLLAMDSLFAVFMFIILPVGFIIYAIIHAILNKPRTWKTPDDGLPDKEDEAWHEGY